MIDLEEADLDKLLERFDQTERALQRKIVGRLMLKIAALEAQRDELQIKRRWLDECNVALVAQRDQLAWHLRDVIGNMNPGSIRAAEAALAKLPKKGG